MAHKIRGMLKSDWSEVRRIYQEGIDTNLATLHSSVPEWDEWDDSHLKSCRLVITENEKILGWAALTPVSGRCVYAGVAEVSIYIDSNWRRCGIGKTLLGELIRESERNGLWTLQSGILEDNAASIRLHEKCGFRMVGYREKLGRDRCGTWKNIVLMEKRSESDRFEGNSPCCEECSCNSGREI